MKTDETLSTTPIATDKTVRGEEIRVLTTGRAGKILPVAYVPVLREDRVSRGTVRLELEMAETLYPLMNAVNVTAYAHFIPYTAFERYQGMDDFNRSYQGEPESHDNKVIPFVMPIKFTRTSEFWRTMGIHMRDGENINSAPLEAYNTLVNWRRRVRSLRLAQRNVFSQTLAEAFWKNPNMYHIVPDYDMAAMDGAVTLNWTSPRVPVSGIGIAAQYPDFLKNTDVKTRVSGGKETLFPALYRTGEGYPKRYIDILQDAAHPGAPAIFAELAQSGVQLSLSNIEMAKQTAAFAKLRAQYAGHDDDYIIDLLMEGIGVPEEALRQPILLDKQSTIFGYTERHAMDGASLQKSVTTGKTQITLNFRTPAMNTGGIILITTEIVPEQLFERMDDRYLGLSNPRDFPNFMRDYLDPEKVEVVQNRYVDVQHGTPTGVFGYAPLNHAWKRSLTRVGGRYYRPLVAGFVEDRQRFWSMEQPNPSLATHFYLVPPNLPHTVFADQKKDPFEVLALGSVEIVGNTVFGKALDENRSDYSKIISQVPKDKAKK